MTITPEQLRDELTRGGRFAPAEIEEFVARAQEIERQHERNRHRQFDHRNSASSAANSAADYCYP